MTYPPPHDPAPQYPAYGPSGSPYGEPAPEAAPGRRGRRGLVVAGVVAGTLVIGGAGFAVAQYLSGGGAQPEEVLPRDTIAFAKLDLDPAANQKAALFSLLQKFPELGDAEGDLKGELLDRWLQESDADIDFAQDVEPWLGDRMALAAVPAPGTDIGVAPLLVLAVTDQQAMSDTLDRVQDEAGADFGYAVRDDFVLITMGQELADDLASADESLVDDADFAGDRDALDGDQIAVAWADLSAAQSVLEQSPAFGGMGFGDQPMSGRIVMGVHVEDDALEIEAREFSVSDLGAGPAGEPTRLVQDLPAGTLAALSVSGAGDAVVEGWADVEATGALIGLEEQIATLGLDLPADLQAVFGSDVVIAVFGDMNNPVFGVRATTDDPQRATEVLDALLGESLLGMPTYNAPAPGGYAVANHPDAADTMGGDGDLGETDVFRDAVPDADEAGMVAFVDLAAALEQLREQGGEGAAEAEKYAALEALGLSASSTDEGGRFVLRITTR